MTLHHVHAADTGGADVDWRGIVWQGGKGGRAGAYCAARHDRRVDAAVALSVRALTAAVEKHLHLALKLAHLEVVLRTANLIGLLLRHGVPFQRRVVHPTRRTCTSVRDKVSGVRCQCVSVYMIP